MTGDGLKQLLTAADATAPAPPLMTDLPRRVRRRQSQRRRNRALAASAAVLLVALPMLTLLRPAGPRQVVHVETITPAGELRNLELQASMHEQTATRLLALQSERARDTFRPDEPSVLAEVRQQRDRAALVLVYDAEQAQREKDAGRALAAYRRAIDLFPTTHWAAVARQRLKEMPT